jgi:hypothetical protein
VPRKPNAPPALSLPQPPDSTDLFEQHAEAIDATMLAMAQGIKILLPCRKRKLTKGEGEWEVEGEDGETVWVYTQPPHPACLKEVTQQNRGRAAQKEARAQAATLVLKLAVPGRDAQIDSYLASLPEDVLARYRFDPELMAHLQQIRDTGLPST